MSYEAEARQSTTLASELASPATALVIDSSMRLSNVPDSTTSPSLSQAAAAPSAYARPRWGKICGNCPHESRVQDGVVQIGGCRPIRDLRDVCYAADGCCLHTRDAAGRADDDIWRFTLREHLCQCEDGCSARRGTVHQPETQLLVAACQLAEGWRMHAKAPVEVSHCGQGGNCHRLPRIVQPASVIDKRRATELRRGKARVRHTLQDREIQNVRQSCLARVEDRAGAHGGAVTLPHPRTILKLRQACGRKFPPIEDLDGVKVLLPARLIAVVEIGALEVIGLLGNGRAGVLVDIAPYR
eukprot:scaffold22833_cov76-Phaeocystis_antarctica.AAC.3